MTDSRTGASPDAPAPTDSPGRWTALVLLLAVLALTAFNALALLPELSISLPSLNDDAFHYMMVQRASEALASGGSPFDQWSPELDLGFPQFAHYQHLPHVTVVFLHRLLLKQVDLLTLFNLVRYLLLLGFPLTVYWSMRQLGCSVVAAGVGAVASTLLSARAGFGFEYDSYIWRGPGIYTQLWAMQLSFLMLGSLNRLLERGTGYVTAVAVTSALALSHLMYSYMMGVGALVILLVGLNRRTARQRIARLAVVGALAAVITSYFWLPFLRLRMYMNVSPYEASWKYDSFGAVKVLTSLANGDLLDWGRLPVLTLLLALGLASAVFTRTRAARLALALFLVWTGLFFGRHTWDGLMDLLPMHERLHLHRFIGAVHLAAILLIGLGGEWIWRQMAALAERRRAVALGVALAVLLAPAVWERWADYAQNREWMEWTRRALDADTDARVILTTLKEQPPGRAYAGRKDNWGKEMKVGFLHFFDLLTFERIPAISPYFSFSLNADLIWHMNEQDPAHYSLFDVRYVVAPRGKSMPAFLRPIKETPRYTLYRTETGGYAEFGTISGTGRFTSQAQLFQENRSWLAGADPAAGRFVRYDSGAGDSGGPSPGTAGCPAGGSITEERVLPGRLDLRVECAQPSTVVLKVTYDPNWRLAVDGRAVPFFMVSPSFIGLTVPAGTHQVSAEYRASPLKSVLLVLGAAVLLGTICLGRRFARLDAFLAGRPGAGAGAPPGPAASP